MPSNDMAQAFAGLPMGQLICGPIVEVAKGQAALCQVYLEYVSKLAYQDGTPKSGTKILTFNLNRPVTKPDGSIIVQPVKVEAPLLSLVPVPAFLMDEATVSFTMEVKEQTASSNETDATVNAEVDLSWWFGSAKISGSVTTKSSNTRSTDQSAKYDVMARATQQPAAEGMSRLTQLFASVIEPIPTAAQGGGGGRK